MLLKARTESDELLKMRSLNTRMELSKDEKFHYSNLEKGYEGEVKFDKLAEGLQEERYIINDLLLKVHKSYFQLDSTHISQGVIRLLDIKNFEGDFYLEKGKFYTVKNNRECKNPIDQLNKSASMFRQLLQTLNLNFLVEAFVIFINPEFTLYEASRDLPIILPTQVHRFLRDLNKIPSKLNDGHKKLAQQLLSLHQTKNPFPEFPQYHYEHLKKGIHCNFCHSFFVLINNREFVCEQCGGHENVEQAILRNVKEFQLLFPEIKITTTKVYDWCQADLSKRTFCRILKKNYTTMGKTSDSFYI